jgi:hypothetical protein
LEEGRLQGYSHQQREMPASTSSTAARWFGTRSSSSFELGTLLRQQWTLFMIRMGITSQSQPLSTKCDESDEIKFYEDSFINIFYEDSFINFFYEDSFIDFLEDCLIEFFED